MGSISNLQFCDIIHHSTIVKKHNSGLEIYPQRSKYSWREPLFPKFTTTFQELHGVFIGLHHQWANCNFLSPIESLVGPLYNHLLNPSPCFPCHNLHSTYWILVPYDQLATHQLGCSRVGFLYAGVGHPNHFHHPLSANSCLYSNEYLPIDISSLSRIDDQATLSSSCLSQHFHYDHADIQFDKHSQFYPAILIPNLLNASLKAMFLAAFVKLFNSCCFHSELMTLKTSIKSSEFVFVPRYLEDMLHAH